MLWIIIFNSSCPSIILFCYYVQLFNVDCSCSITFFLTHTFRSRRGFHVSLQATCGGYVSSTRGLLTSPGYPDNYPADTECEWVIRMRPATMITFRFLDLDIGAESDTECSQDYLVIRNGERASSPFFLINPRQGNNQVSNVDFVTIEMSNETFMK